MSRLKLDNKIQSLTFGFSKALRFPKQVHGTVASCWLLLCVWGAHRNSHFCPGCKGGLICRTLHITGPLTGHKPLREWKLLPQTGSKRPYCERSEKGKSLLCLVFFFFPFPLRQSAHNRWGQGMDGGCDEVLVNIARYFVPGSARASILKLHRGLILSTALHPTSHN